MKFLKNKPPLMIILTFAGAIILGAILLKLPFATHNGISFVDALFTSTSAVCVTGLIVHDTGTYFTMFGQCVILLLIQLGGIGILTVFAFIIGITSGHLRVAERGWIEGSLTQQYRGYLFQFVKRVLIFVFGAEAIGAILLFPCFIRQYSWGKAIFLSVFHSVSAFCNAGFSLFSDSLVAYRSDAYFNAVIMLLIIFGGIGFVVAEDVVQVVRKKKRTLSFHSKIALSTTLVLIIMGALVVWGLEANNSFREYSPGEKILAALFQSVTCRTAGFNTVDLTQLSEGTLFASILLMVIGGSPGSTAGGIKTTSLAMMMLLIASRFRGREKPEVFGRTVSRKTIERIITLVLTSFILITASIWLLLACEQGSPYWSQLPRPFLTTMFEVASAFGTVGLSMGMTPLLSLMGKWIIIFLMFIGRLGPLTFVLLMMVEANKASYEYPEEEIMVG